MGAPRHDRRQGRTGAVGRGFVHAGVDAPTRPLADRSLALQRETGDAAERANLPQETWVPAASEVMPLLYCGAGEPLGLRQVGSFEAPVSFYRRSGDQEIFLSLGGRDG